MPASLALLLAATVLACTRAVLAADATFPVVIFADVSCNGTKSSTLDTASLDGALALVVPCSRPTP